jgi:hypothetical protein
MPSNKNGLWPLRWRRAADSGRKVGRRDIPFALAAIPAIALSLAIPLANRMEPSFGGAPFLLVWIVAWVIATPFFLSAAHRLLQRP